MELEEFELGREAAEEPYAMSEPIVISNLGASETEVELLHLGNSRGVSGRRYVGSEELSSGDDLNFRWEV